jgi:hypothetical protein
MKMKNFFVAAIVFIALPASALASEFCAGFERGYATGYKQASGSGLDPLTPLCPLQPLKSLNDPQSDFEHGYLIGLQKGVIEGR